jgi:ribonuclease P protein component
VTAQVAAPASCRLRSAADIGRVFASRRVAHGETVVVHVRHRGDAAAARWTAVAGKKVGDAVRRNRAKRRVRALMSQLDLPAGLDLVVVARADAHAVSAATLRADVTRTVEQAVAQARRAGR